MAMNERDLLETGGIKLRCSEPGTPKCPNCGDTSHSAKQWEAEGHVCPICGEGPPQFQCVRCGGTLATSGVGEHPCKSVEIFRSSERIVFEEESKIARRKLEERERTRLEEERRKRTEAEKERLEVAERAEVERRHESEKEFKRKAEERREADERAKRDKAAKEIEIYRVRVITQVRNLIFSGLALILASFVLAWIKPIGFSSDHPEIDDIRAALKGDPAAMNNVAVIYKSGVSNISSGDKSNFYVAWFLAAAMAGNQKATSNLINMSDHEAKLALEVLKANGRINANIE